METKSVNLQRVSGGGRPWPLDDQKSTRLKLNNIKRLYNFVRYLDKAINWHKLC